MRRPCWTQIHEKRFSGPEVVRLERDASQTKNQVSRRNQ
jgi:hypothetical protein